MATNKDKKHCAGKCKKEQKIGDFYASSDLSMFPDGRLHICKQCIKEMIDLDNMDTVYRVLHMINKPFLIDAWSDAIKSSHDTFGVYIRIINGKQYKDKKWEDSVYSPSIPTTIDADFPTGNPANSSALSFESKSDSFLVTDEMMEKWGYGFKSEEYMYFEKKYNFLRNNYPERTALHTEALKDYVIKKVKEDMYIAAGDVDKASKWSKMASEAATAAKINPNQLSKADLSSGLDGFGQLVRSVEQAVDVVAILPAFKERPQDKVDFAIWCYVNYIRDMKGLPLAEYGDVYKFYEDRVKEYESSNADDSEELY